MPNGTYGGVRGTETKVGQKTFVSRPTRSLMQTPENQQNVATSLRDVTNAQTGQKKSRASASLPRLRGTLRQREH